MKAKNIQEYLGSLQQTVVTSWRKHLKSSKHSEHVILNDFYDDMLDAVDDLTEAYMSHNGKVEGYVNLFTDTKKLSAYDYVKTIHDFAEENRDIVGEETELQSLVDDVLAVCDTAMYKLKELVGESNLKSLSNFINEAMVFEKSTSSLSSDARWIANTAIKMLKQYDSKYNDWTKITIEDRDDDFWDVYYNGKFVDAMDIFPRNTIDSDEVYDLIQELKWM